jgi:acetyl esterase/lipase
MIGSKHALGNLRRIGGRPGRVAVALAALLLGGCADVFFATLGEIGPANGVRSTRDIVFYAQHDLALDLYAPQGARDAPVIVFFHGGSWETGKRRWYRYVGDALASRGVVTVIPDYRKFPEVRFPAFMHDAAHAVAWAREHAREHGGDPARVFVMGHSAGGQIAALLTADPRYLAEVGLRPRDLAGMIGLAGAYAFLPFVGDEARIFGDDPTGRHDSQPINFIDGDEPPLLLLHGLDDDEVSPRNAELLAQRAQATNGPVILKLYPGVGHASILLSFARGRYSRIPALSDTLAFIAHPPALTADGQ